MSSSKGVMGRLRQAWKEFKALRIKEGNGTEVKELVVKKPTVVEVKQKGAGFDQITHTGQAWDEADYRRARFEYSQKQVNPNFAAHLIAELPPVASEDSVVRCDGGHRELGHPRVYINLDKPGTHACGYCGQRFYNVHSTKGNELNNAHIQV